MNSLQEKIILSRIRHGDKEAFGQLYDLYVDKIYRFIYFRVPTIETAQDLTSDCFLKVFQYLTKDAPRIESLKAFIYRVARNLVTDYYRARGERPISIENELTYEVAAEEINQEERIEISFQFKEIEKALTKIKDEWREVIILHYIEDYSIKEIAQILEKTEGAIRVLLHRAIRALREVLNK